MIPSCVQDFPALDQKVGGRRLVYMDSAATTLKPRSVIECLHHFYQYETANVHRGSHYLSDRATEKFESARGAVKEFLNANDAREIVFTAGTTDGLNLLAQTLSQKILQQGDEVLISEMEHHANIVPWQMVAERKNIKIQWVAVTEQGELDMQDFARKLSPKTKVVSLVHASNTLGTVNDLAKCFQMARSVGAITIADAAQSVSFLPIDVQKLGCDFLVFSAHKLYGPYGIGVLYGRWDKLNQLPPYRGGGAMISSVTKEKTEFLDAPQRFEAGTPNISGVIGLSAAIGYVQKIGLSHIAEHEAALTQRALMGLSQIKGIQFLGQSNTRTNIISFNISGMHPSDVGQVLSEQGLAVRVGHHCTQPLMRRFGVTGSIRVSFGVYNRQEDVDNLLQALNKAQEILT